MANSVLLVTLEGINYGNRLQHYAMQRAIEKYGYEVNSLSIKRSERTDKKLKETLKIALAFMGIPKYRPSLYKYRRKKRFLAFNRTFLPHMISVSADDVWRMDWSSYVCAVTGSDQVWHNWHLKAIPNELAYYYLEFIEESKRVSYAPSFGFTGFPEEDLEAHRHGLMGMRALSCREQEGCEMIRALVGREAQKVLDPTLLLTAEDWEKIETKPRFRVPDRYLLLFFLGEETQEYHSEIEGIANERGLKTLNIQDPKYCAISPDEFVWLIHHADTVCTDSFHATAFSITFGRNLRVFHRQEEGFKDMFGRLHDLLEPLGLMNVVYGVGDALSTALSDEARAYLEQEREASLRYLRKNLSSQ